MKKGPITLIVLALGLVVALYFAPRTLKSTENINSIETEEHDHDHTEHDHELSELDKKVEDAIQIIQNGQGPPMKAIGMLLDVVEQDPEHFRATLALGEFSMQSGQYDKAINRFKKLLEIDAEYADAHLRLGESYAALQQNEEAIEELNIYIKKSSDEEGKSQAQQLLNQLQE